MTSPHDLDSESGCSPLSETPIPAEAELAAEPEQVASDSGVEAFDESLPGEPPDQPPTALDGEMPESQETVPAPGDAMCSGASCADAPRRALKLVLTLKPGDGPRTVHVVMAIGAEGCDPLLRSEKVEDLQAALDLVPGLLAEAEARWQSQPRYPRVSPRAGAKLASNLPKDASQPPRERLMPSSESQQPNHQPVPSSPSSSQLTLFG